MLTLKYRSADNCVALASLMNHVGSQVKVSRQLCTSCFFDELRRLSSTGQQTLCTYVVSLMDNLELPVASTPDAQCFYQRRCEPNTRQVAWQKYKYSYLVCFGLTPTLVVAFVLLVQG